MATAGEIVKQFYDAAVARDLAMARTYLADDLVFVGLFETYRRAEAALAEMLVTVGPCCFCGRGIETTEVDPCRVSDPWG